MLIDGAPHGGEMFDTERIREAVISFLNMTLSREGTINGDH